MVQIVAKSLYVASGFQDRHNPARRSLLDWWAHHARPSLFHGYRAPSESDAMLDVATSIAATGSGTLPPTHRAVEKIREKDF